MQPITNSQSTDLILLSHIWSLDTAIKRIKGFGEGKKKVVFVFLEMGWVGGSHFYNEVLGEVIFIYIPVQRRPRYKRNKNILKKQTIV